MYLKKNAVSIEFGAGRWGSTCVHTIRQREVCILGGLLAEVALQSREEGKVVVGGLLVCSGEGCEFCASIKFAGS